MVGIWRAGMASGAQSWLLQLAENLPEKAGDRR
jgi:hypothetical protein